MFLVLTLNREMEIDTTYPWRITRTVDLSYHEGMIGAAPIFETRDAAEKAYPHRKVIEVGTP